MSARPSAGSILAGAALALLAACAADRPAAAKPRSAPASPAPPLGDIGFARPAAPQPAVESSAPAPTAATGAAPSTPASQGGPAPSAQRIGSAAGVPITMDELVLAWHEVSAREIGLVVEKLLATRFAFAEAARLGLAVDPALIEDAVARRRAELEAEAQKAEGSPTLAAYIARHFDMESSIYFERMRSAAVRQAVAEQAIRAWTLGNPTREVRIVTLDKEDEMKEVESAARAGQDFAALAREHSTDETARQGGLVPFVVREERSPLARLAFATPVGEIGGPVWVGGHGFLVRVEGERSPLEATGPELSEAVTRSLALSPVTDAEFIHWKIQMEKAYPVDLEPLRRLLGAPEGG